MLWSPFVPFDQVAGLAVEPRPSPLTSSFRPTYNMAANLVRRYAPDEAHHLLNLSFAQYQADSDVVRLEAQLERTAEEAETEARQRRRVRAGRRRASTVGCWRRGRRSRARAGPPTGPTSRERPGARLRPGDVLVVPGGKTRRRVAVLSTAAARGGDTRAAA